MDISVSNKKELRKFKFRFGTEIYNIYDNLVVPFGLQDCDEFIPMKYLVELGYLHSVGKILSYFLFKYNLRARKQIGILKSRLECAFKAEDYDKVVITVIKVNGKKFRFCYHTSETLSRSHLDNIGTYWSSNFKINISDYLNELGKMIIKWRLELSVLTDSNVRIYLS